MRKKITKMLLSGLLLMGLSCVGVQAETLTAEDLNLPDSFTTHAEDITNMDHVISNGVISEPEAAENSFIWNTSAYVNREEFRELLVEGGDNDGVSDFLIDPYSCAGIKVMRVTVLNDAGEEVEADAIAYKVKTIAAGYTSFESMDDAKQEAADFFVDTYNTTGAGFLVTMEEIAYQNPEIFWLSGDVYLTISAIDEECEEYWSGLYEETVYTAQYSADLYCLLAIPDLGYDIRHEVYRHPAIIKNAISEMKTIANKVVKEVDGMDEITKIKYFNEWLTTHNELNTTYITEEELAELFAKHPDSMNCLGALRGGTGTYAPTSQAYASAFKVLCDAGNVTCNVIPGKAGNATDKRPHVWNEVKIYQTYYAVDTAWNDLTDQKNVAVSGDESDTYLLVGGNTSLPVENQNLTFWASHSVKKDSVWIDDFQFKYSYLGGNAYESNLKYMKLTATDNYVVVGYENLPTVTVQAQVGSEMQYKVKNWAIYRVDNGYTLVYEQKGSYNNSDSFTFPAKYAEPGVYSIRGTYTTSLSEINADIKITIAKFDDVKSTDWFQKSVEWAIQNDITSGYTNTAFAPYVNCSRGQLVTFLWRFFGCPEPETKEMPFKDVSSSVYYHDAVLWASENDYVKGYTADKFAPDKEITRAELATILWRVAGKPIPEEIPEEEIEEQLPEEGTEVEVPEEGNESEVPEEGTEDELPEEKTGFSDVSKEDWYYLAVYWAAENNITKGYSEDIFAPGATATRSEIVTFLYRAKDILANI